MPHLSLHERDDGVVPGLAILSNHTVSFDHKVFRISITFLISWSFWHVYESCVMHDALRRLCCKLRSILFWRFCVAGDVARKKIATCAMRNISRFRSLELNNSQTVLGWREDAVKPIPAAAGLDKCLKSSSRQAPLRVLASPKNLFQRLGKAMRRWVGGWGHPEVTGGRQSIKNKTQTWNNLKS